MSLKHKFSKTRRLAKNWTNEARKLERQGRTDEAKIARGVASEYWNQYRNENPLERPRKMRKTWTEEKEGYVIVTKQIWTKK